MNRVQKKIIFAIITTSFVAMSISLLAYGAIVGYMCE